MVALGITNTGLLSNGGKLITGVQRTTITD